MNIQDSAAKFQSRPVERIEAEPVNAARLRQPLYAPRKKIHPKRAEGFFRRFKWLVMLVTLGIYYAAPWIRWDRGPHAPDQAILLDVANRRFYFFFVEIWPQEFYFVAGLLIMAGLGLFLMTTAVGRAWCGYACPQTVWVDLFLVVERAVEGDRNARIKLDAAPCSAGKAAKRVLKHSIWLLIGVLTGGAWIFYFADAPTLAYDFVTFQAAPIAYFTVATLTATTYIFGGLMREQVCTYMCPWPRIQAAMLDENSLVVTYNDWRGEPRSRHTKKAAAAGVAAGDCVDCNACVAVCPMGIDIRDGLQLECITCALCIDACDGVMDKLGREKGLIGYSTLADYSWNMGLATSGNTAPIDPSLVRKQDGGFTDKVRQFDWKVIIRPRILIYTGLWLLVGVGLLVGLAMRERLQLDVLHDRNPQYVLESSGAIRNGYTIKILNMRPEPRDFTLTVHDLAGAKLTVAGDPVSRGGALDIQAEPDSVHKIKVFVSVPKDLFPDRTHDFVFRVAHGPSGENAEYQATFNVPEKQR